MYTHVSSTNTEISVLFSGQFQNVDLCFDPNTRAVS